MPARTRARGYDGIRLAPLMLRAYALAEEAGDAVRAGASDFGGLAALALARACQAVHSANLLGANGLIGDAMTVARTPVELAIDLAYIALEPATRTAAFRDHDHVRKYGLAQAIAELHRGDVDREAMAELQRRADEAMARHPSLAPQWMNHRGWAGVSIARRAREGDRGSLYALLYRDMCDASHSGHGALEYALVDLDDSPKIHYGPMQPDEGPAVLAAGALMTLVATVVDAGNLEQRYGVASTELMKLLVGG